jgi:hypothetical protein
LQIEATSVKLCPPAALEAGSPGRQQVVKARFLFSLACCRFEVEELTREANMKSYKKEALKDPEFKAAYHAPGPEYTLAGSLY